MMQRSVLGILSGWAVVFAMATFWIIQSLKEIREDYHRRIQRQASILEYIHIDEDRAVFGDMEQDHVVIQITRPQGIRYYRAGD